VLSNQSPIKLLDRGKREEGGRLKEGFGEGKTIRVSNENPRTICGPAAAIEEGETGGTGILIGRWLGLYVVTHTRGAVRQGTGGEDIRGGADGLMSRRKKRPHPKKPVDW